MQAGGVDDDQLRVVSLHQPRIACRVVCGLLLVIATSRRPERSSALTCRRSAVRPGSRSPSVRHAGFPDSSVSVGYQELGLTDRFQHVDPQPERVPT